MTIRTILLLPVLILVQLASAQVITVSEDLPFKPDEVYELLGEMEDHYLVYRNLIDEHELIAFNQEMKIRWRKPIELFGRRPKVLAVNSDGQLINVLYLDRYRGETQLMLSQFDAGANFRDSMTVYAYDKSYYAPVPEIVFSEDKKRLVAYHVNRQQEVHALGFDLEGLQLLWEAHLPSEYFGRPEEFEKALVDNKGSFYMIFSRDDQRLQSEKAYILEILEIRSGRKSPLLVKVPMQEHMIYDLAIEVDELNQQLVAGGFYSDDNRGKANGYFYLTYSFDSGKKFFIQFHPFTPSFLSNLLGRQSKKTDEIEDVDIPEIVLRRDGGILLIGELNHKIERYATNPGRPYTYTTAFSVSFFYDDLFVISIHPDGSVHWETIFYKKQYSQDDDAIYSSYFMVKTPLSLRFIFNDEIKQENTVSEYILKGDGKYWRNSVMSTKDQKIRLRFTDAVQVGVDEVIVPSDRRGKLKLVRIKY
jgi:hypothetical protein